MSYLSWALQLRMAHHSSVSLSISISVDVVSTYNHAINTSSRTSGKPLSLRNYHSKPISSLIFVAPMLVMDSSNVSCYMAYPTSLP